MSEAEASADETEHLLGQRQYADAERCGRRAIALGPRLPRAHCVLSLILRETGRPGEAEDAAREAIRLDPASTWAHAHLAVILRKAGRLGEAESAEREAIRLDPAQARAYTILGALLNDTGRTTQAQAAFDEAIRLDPALTLSRNNPAGVTSIQRRWPQLSNLPARHRPPP